MPSFQESAATLAFVKSPTGLARNASRPFNHTLFQILHAVIPICGFGKFTGASVGCTPVFTDEWPNVYQVLTETLTISQATVGVGTISNTATVISTYSQNFDTFYSQSLTDPGNIYPTAPPSWVPAATFSGGNTGMSQSGSLTVGSVTNTYAYTASVSSLYVPNWAALTAQATALLAGIAFPPWSTNVDSIGPACISASVGPMAASPYATTVVWTADYGWDGSLLLAAANGLVARLPAVNQTTLHTCSDLTTTGPFDAVFGSLAANSLVQDLPTPANAIALEGACANAGYLICAKSRWQLTASEPLNSDYTLVMAQCAYSHLPGVWGQAMNWVGSAPTMNRVTMPKFLGPYAANTPRNFSGSFPPYTMVTFEPADVVTCLNGANLGNYGVLGFRQA